MTPDRLPYILTACLILILLGHSCSLHDTPVPLSRGFDTTYSDFFRQHGSPYPDVMSNAVAQTKRPALMAAIAVKESNGDPTAVGDGGESLGAFQVQPKHWGKVSDDPIQQALQAERILEDLMDSPSGRGLRQTLARYNGGTKPPRISYRYAAHVMELKKGVQR